MIKKIFSFFLVIFPIALYGGIPPQPKVYYCNEITSQINIDGEIDEDVWINAEWTDLFIDIQGGNQPKPYYDTKAKMLWDSEFLYIAARLEEPDIWANLTRNESVIYYDNDFEVFLDPDGDTHNYLEFEFNALNVWWDLYLSKPYRAGGIPMTGWTCDEKKAAVKNAGTINDPTGPADSYWTIEIAIPHKCVSEVISGKYIRPKIEEVWRINFSRVQWKTQIVDGKYSRIDSPEENWVWSPQGKIDMHMPEFWGYLVFVGEGIDSSMNEYIDVYWEVKYKLMTLFAAERLYHRTNGRFNLNIKELISKEELEYGDVTIDIEHNRLLFSIKQENLIWFVNETGRLWSEDIQ